MDMLPFDPVELVAIDPARNVRRRWRVAVSRDLFGMLVVETMWGRAGAAGRRLTRSFADERQAAAHVRALLARRAGAVRRIGVAYRPADMSTGRRVSAPPALRGDGFVNQ